MVSQYEEEQKKLRTRVSELEPIINQAKASASRAKEYISLVKESTAITELTPEIVRKFIRRILISERQIVNGEEEQTVKIVFTYND